MVKPHDYHRRIIKTLLGVYYHGLNPVNQRSSINSLRQREASHCIWSESTSGGLPLAFLHNVDGPVDSAWRATDIPIPHFKVAVLDRGGQEHTVIR